MTISYFCHDDERWGGGGGGVKEVSPKYSYCCKVKLARAKKVLRYSCNLFAIGCSQHVVIKVVYNGFDSIVFISST